MHEFTAMTRTSTRLEGRQLTIFVAVDPARITHAVWALAELYTAAFPQLHLHVQCDPTGRWSVGNLNAPANIRTAESLERAVGEARSDVVALLRVRLMRMRMDHATALIRTPEEEKLDRDEIAALARIVDA